MLAMRQYSLAGSLVLLIVLACDQIQPVEPAVEAAFTAASGPTVKAPSNTNAVAVSVSRIDVSWQDNSPNETGFEVHRSTTGPSGTFTLLAPPGRNATAFGDTGLVPSTQYCYKVRAFKTSDGRTAYSQFSPTACATVLASEPPAAPWLWGADGYFLGTIALSWSDHSNNEDGFTIEACWGVTCGDADFTAIAFTGANVTGYTVTVGNFGIYTFRLRATNGAGASAPSNQMSGRACNESVDQEAPCYP